MPEPTAPPSSEEEWNHATPASSSAAAGERPSATAQISRASKSRVAPLSRFFVNHTKKTCAVSCIIPVLSILIIIVTRSFSMDDPGSSDYFIRNDERTRLGNARAALLRDHPYKSLVDAGANLSQVDHILEYGMYVLLRGRDPATGAIGTLKDFSSASNVLTRDSFILQKRAEDAVLNHPEYQSFCLKDPNVLDCEGKPRACVFPESFLNHRLLFGVENDDGEICDRRSGSDLSENNFNDFLEFLFDDEDPQPFYFTFFSSNISRSDSRSWTAYSYIPIGLPLPDFNGVDDRPSEQLELYLEWAKVVSEDANDLTTSSADVLALSSELGSAQFSDIALRDLSFSIVAIVIVFLIIWIHTSSAFLSSMSMLQIVISFPVAYLIYNFILRQFYFGSLQLLTIFLILGIGADDVFVFTDAWKQAGVVLGPDVDLITRMNWTYRRSVRAMTVTSFTTAAAFFVTATSPIMPISTLGVWAGILILVQFFFVITIYPCAVIIWHRFWRPRFFIRGFRRANDEDVETEASTPLWHRFLPASRRPVVKSAASGDYRAIERFFRGPWFNFVYKIRFFLVLLAVALVAVGVWLATGLEPPATSEEFLPSDHPVRVAFRTLDYGFPRSDADLQLRVRISWGIEDVDRSGTSKFEPDEEGTAVLDLKFDLKRKDVQTHVLKSCSFFNDKDLLIESETIEKTSCWIADYQTWRREELSKDEFEDFDSEKELVTELVKFGEHSDDDGTKPYLKYLQGSDIVLNEDRSQVLMTEVKFVSNKDYQIPYRLMWPVYTSWQEELEKLNAEAPAGGKQAIATAGLSWQWQMTQKALVRSMFTGIGVMVVVALVTLMIATLNWTIAVLAMLSIAGIIAMLLGIIRILGWDLGISESIGVVISIGYSFDGAAHIATAYIESKSKSRADKTRDALTDLGISILFGVLTTLGAGLMLFPAIIVFFVKFAGLIVSTVLLSLIWSLGFFPALLCVCGPEGDFGSLVAICRRLFGRRNKQRDVEVEDIEQGEKDVDGGSLTASQTTNKNQTGNSA